MEIGTLRNWFKSLLPREGSTASISTIGNKICLKTCCIYFCLLSFSFELNSQNDYENFVIKKLDLNDGLPSVCIKAMEMDSYGYIWIGTEMGLVRYDGSKILLFSDNNPLHHRISRMSVRNNQLMLQYANSKTLTIHTNEFDSRKFTPIDDSLIDDNYNLYNMKNYYNLICKLDSNIKNLFTPYNLGNVSRPFFISDLSFYFEHGRKYYYSDTKMNYQKLEIIGKKYHIDYFYKPYFFIFNNSDNFFYQFQNSKLIKKFIPNGISPGDRSLLPTAHYFRCSNIDKWYMQVSDNIYELNMVNNELRAEIKIKGIKIPKIMCAIYQASSKRYVFGTQNDGVYILSFNPFKYIHTPGFDIQNAHGFYNKLYTDGYEFLSNGTIVTKRHKIDNKLIASTPNGLFYVKDHKLTLLQNDKEKIIKQPVNIGYTDVVYDRKKDRAYIIGTQSIYQLSGDSLKTLATFVVNGLHFYCGLLSYDSILYLGSSQGFYTYNVLNKKMRQVLNNAEIRQIYRDYKGRIWLGSYGSGYFLYENNKAIPMPMDKMQRLKSVHFFYIDKKNRMWMTTNNGLINVDYSALEAYLSNKNSQLFYRIYTTEDGLSTNEFNGGCSPAGLLLPNGVLSLPSMKGLLQFYPDSIQTNESNSRIRLDQVLVNNELYNLTKKLLFANYSKDLTFQFSFPSYENNETIQLEYRLEGHSNKWYPITNKNEIVFHGLKGGQYKLQIRVIGKRDSARVYPFEIEKKWYDTIGFQLIVFTIVVCLGYFIAMLRNRYTHKQNERLQLLVETKTTELQNTIHELDHSILALENSESELSKLLLEQNDLLKLVLHDLRSPIDNLKWTITRIKSKILQADKASQIELELEELDISIKKVQRFIHQFFNWIYKQRTGLQPHKQKVWISSIYEAIEIQTLYSGLLKFDSNEVEIITDPNILSVILVNLIDNAHKANPEGHISIQTYDENGKLFITITNEGSTLPKETIDKILNQEYESETGGFGYKIIIKFLKLLDGNLHIESKNNRTTVTLTFEK